MSRPLRRHRGQREAQRVGAVFVDQVERVDDVALRLRHLGAALVAHQRVDVDVVSNGTSFMKCRPIIIMRATQKKMMSKPVTSVVGRVVALHLRRLVGPAERRERPQRRGEPGVEHVLVALEEARAAVRAFGDLVGLFLGQHVVDDVVGERLGQRLVLALGDEHLVVRPVPGRDLVSPPDLARDAPRLDVLHPVEIRLLPVLRHEAGAAGRAPPRSPARPAPWRRRTIGRSGTARSRRRRGRRAAPCGCAARPCRGSRRLRGVRRSSCAPRSGRRRAATASRSARETAPRRPRTRRSRRGRACRRRREC